MLLRISTPSPHDLDLQPIQIELTQTQPYGLAFDWADINFTVGEDPIHSQRITLVVTYLIDS